MIIYHNKQNKCIKERNLYQKEANMDGKKKGIKIEILRLLNEEKKEKCNERKTSENDNKRIGVYLYAPLNSGFFSRVDQVAKRLIDRRD